MRTWAALAALVLGVLGAFVGCGERTLADVACPPAGTSLTYETFGEGFFDAYCMHCHGAGREGYAARSFTSAARIREDRERVFAVAAGDNVSMPPGPDDPPENERAKLAEWLACGAP